MKIIFKLNNYSFLIFIWLFYLSEQLIEQWSKLDCLNAIEEQGLKLMLKTDNEKILANQTKDSFDDWEIAIFGCKLPCVNNVEKNLNNLVMAR